jgi:hypothetical protein
MMHRSETESLVSCADCGAEVGVATARSYGFGERGVLCFDCALRRGGQYDERLDRWCQPPRTDDLGIASD